MGTGGESLLQEDVSVRILWKLFHLFLFFFFLSEQKPTVVTDGHLLCPASVLQGAGE